MNESAIKTVIFVIAIFVSIWFTIINVIRTIYKNRFLPMNGIIMAAAYTAVITHLIGIW